MNDTWLHWEDARLDQDDLQGIEYLAYDEASGTLTVHLNLPADGIDEDSVRLECGPGTSPPSWALSFPTQDGDRLAKIELTFATSGDGSRCTVQLLDGGDFPLHPFFSSDEFVFQLDCEKGDCRPTHQAAERAAAKPPAVDLKTKDYRGFLNVLAERVQTTNPNWSDLAPASVEQTLLEMLSHHGDMLSYYQDRVANEAFVETATQRLSMRRHGELLGYELFEGISAETFLAFQVQQDGQLPEGLEVHPEGAASSGPTYYLTAPLDVDNARNQLPLAYWPGADSAVLPEGTRRVWLFGDWSGLRPGMKLALRNRGFTQVVTLGSTRAFDRVGWVEFDPGAGLPPEPPDAAERVTEVVWEEPLRTSMRPYDGHFEIHGNVAKARHGRLMGASISSVTPSGFAPITPSRHNSVRDRDPVSDEVRLRALRLPTPDVTRKGTEDGSRPVVHVEVGGQTWYRVDHFDHSRSFDRHYTTYTDQNGHLWLQFGDGERGDAIVLLPGTDPELHVEYRVGQAISGHCPPDTLDVSRTPADTALASRVLDISPTPTNVTPGMGGRPPESLDEARRNVPESIRHGRLERAVTLEDYAALAVAVEGVARATARSLGGPFDTVLVMVDPVGQTEPPPALLERVESALDDVRMTGREVQVIAPEYVPLEVELAICTTPGHSGADVREAVMAALRPGRDERRGFFHPDELSFGEDIELSEVVAAAQSVAGVRSVKALVFRKLQVRSPHDVRSVIPIGDREVARLDADPRFPEHGVLRVKTYGIDEIDDVPLVLKSPVEPSGSTQEAP